MNYDQDWKIVNIDKLCGYDCALRHHMFLKKQRLLKLLKLPRWVPVKYSSKSIGELKSRSTSQLLNKLPQELIDAITAVLNSGDILPLALTCSYFFRLLAPEAQAALKADSAPWAGDRLIIVGRYCNRESSNGSFSREDIETVESANYVNKRCYMQVHDETGERTFFYPKSESSAAIVGVHRDAVRKDLYQRLKSVGAEEDELKLVSRLLGVLRRESDQTRYFANPDQSFHCSYCRQRAVRRAVERTQVLRNLTTKEFVRQHALGGYDGYFTLASAIFRSAHWTDDEPGAPVTPDRHGRWAGHHFDVAMVEDVRGDEWRDVTQMLVEDLEVASDTIGYDDRQLRVEEDADGARQFAAKRWKEERLL